MTEKVYIGIGSNVGDKEGNIREALRLLSREDRLSSPEVAPLYKTDPVGYTGQDWFLNTVASFETAMFPHDLLEVLMGIENMMGRVRTVRWGPRVIDLDILLYGGLKVDTPDLQVPHPRLEERAFAVVPLADLSPGLLLPCGTTASRLAAELSDKQKVERYTGA